MMMMMVGVKRFDCLCVSFSWERIKFVYAHQYEESSAFRGCPAHTHTQSNKRSDNFEEDFEHEFSSSSSLPSLYRLI